MTTLPAEIIVEIGRICDPISTIVMASSCRELHNILRVENIKHFVQNCCCVTHYDSRDDRNQSVLYCALTQVIKNGGSELFLYFTRDCKWNYLPFRAQLLRTAARYSNIAMVDILIDSAQLIKWPAIPPSIYRNATVLTHCIQEGYIRCDEDLLYDVLMYAGRDSLRVILDNSIFSSDMCDVAAMAGNLDCLEYLVSLGYTLKDRDTVVRTIVKEDYEDVMEYLTNVLNIVIPSDSRI